MDQNKKVAKALGITSLILSILGLVCLIGCIVSIITIVLFVLPWMLILALFIFFADVIHFLSGLGQMG